MLAIIDNIHLTGAVFNYNKLKPTDFHGLEQSLAHWLANRETVVQVSAAARTTSHSC